MRRNTAPLNFSATAPHFVRGKEGVGTETWHCHFSSISCLLSPSHLLSHVSCLKLLSPVSCILSHDQKYTLSYLLTPFSCLLFLVCFCLLSLVCCLLPLVSCLTHPVSRLLSLVSCLFSSVSCLLSLLYHVSCLTSFVSRLLSHVSCLLSPLPPIPTLNWSKTLF